MLHQTSQYSQSRLHAFNQYCCTTSIWRRLAVILLSPWLSISVFAILNLVPLEDPYRVGWKGQTLFFIRVGLAVVLHVIGSGWLRSMYLPQVPVSKRVRIFVIVVLTLVYTLVYCGLSALWTFPVPYGMLLPLVVTVPIGFILQKIFFHVKLRKQRSTRPHTHSAMLSNTRSFYTNSSLTLAEKQLKVYKRLHFFHMILPFLYSFLAASFRSFGETGKIAMTFVFFFVKCALSWFPKRYFFPLFPSHTAEGLVFSVTFFHSLFMSMCIGTASSSSATTALIMVLDIAQIFVETYQVYMKLRQVEGTLQNKTVCEKGMGGPNRRIFPLQSSETKPKIPGPTRIDLLSVLSLPNNPQGAAETTNLRDLSPILEQLEYVVLMEYAEAFIPFLYGLYMMTAFASPNRDYFIETRDVSWEIFAAGVFNMFLYGSLELVSLLFLFLLIKWRFQFNVLNFLAFVLENSWRSIQGKLLYFLPILLNCNLLHTGMDFTLQFKWLNHTNVSDNNSL